jgi:micrococcal nuclease
MNKISIILFFIFLALPVAAGDLSATVTHVVDGDTIHVRLAESGIDENVRIIGMDSPEMGKRDRKPESGAIEATARARELLDGKKIFLRLDPANIGIGHRDRYRRLLAHVILPDGSFFAETMIAEGHAKALLHFAFDPELMKRYQKAEENR